MTPRDERGFTLVEMSVVLIVIGLVILTVFPALNAVRAGNQRSLTQSNMQALLRATAAYVQANGCLPCPTPPTVIGAGFGTVRGDNNPAACINLNVSGTSTLTCGAEGIPPYVSLGVPASTARDGWGRWISMRIDTDLAVLPYPGAAGSAATYVPPASPCTATDVTNGVCSAAQLGLNQKGICRTGLSVNNRVNVTVPGGGTQRAAVLFVSYGADGYGAFVAAPALLNGNINGCRNSFPSLPVACTQAMSCSSAAACNLTDGVCFSRCNAAGNNQFVDAPPRTTYDDTLAFAGLDALLGMLGSGVCTNGW